MNRYEKTSITGYSVKDMEKNTTVQEYTVSK